MDGRPWPPLEGIVSIDEVMLESGKIFVGVQVECVFHFRSTVTGIKQDKVLFSEMKRLAIEVDENISSDTRDSLRTPTKKRFKAKFSFEFGSKSLAPSLIFDVAELHNERTPFGISWAVVGFLAHDQSYTQYCSRDDFKMIAQAIIPFHVSYRYTEPGIQQSLPAILNPITARNSSFALFKPNVDLQISLDKALLPQMTNVLSDHQERPSDQGRHHHLLKITLNLSNTSISTRILNIKVTLQQKILIQVSSIKHRFKKTVELFDDSPSPSYYMHPAGNQLKYDLAINSNEINLESIIQKSDLAKKGFEEGCATLTTSTIFSRLDGSGSGVEVEYSLKIMVSVADDSSVKPIIFSSKVPLVVSAEDRDATATFEGASMTADDFLPIISSLIEDIKFARDGLDLLIAEWDRYRAEASQSERMCTESSDHALVILEDMMGSFQLQVGFFEEFIGNPTLSRKAAMFGWPDKSSLIPFNMFLLELELLVRAHPRPPTPPHSVCLDSAGVEENEPLVLQLLMSSKRFLTYAHTITVSWIRGEVLADMDKSSLLQSYHSEVRVMYELLSLVAEGNDSASGVEQYKKYQADLSNALSRSKLT